MSGLTTGSQGLSGGEDGFLQGTGLSTPPGLLANTPTALPTSSILLETGSYLLQENGTSHFLLE